VSDTSPLMTRERMNPGSGRLWWTVSWYVTFVRPPPADSSVYSPSCPVCSRPLTIDQLIPWGECSYVSV